MHNARIVVQVIDALLELVEGRRILEFEHIYAKCKDCCSSD
jgi:hypothetical protein